MNIYSVQVEVKQIETEMKTHLKIMLHTKVIQLNQTLNLEIGFVFIVTNTILHVEMNVSHVKRKNVQSQLDPMILETGFVPIVI